MNTENRATMQDRHPKQRAVSCLVFAVFAATLSLLPSAFAEAQSIALPPPGDMLQRPSKTSANADVDQSGYRIDAIHAQTLARQQVHQAKQAMQPITAPPGARVTLPDRSPQAESPTERSPEDAIARIGRAVLSARQSLHHQAADETIRLAAREAFGLVANVQVERNSGGLSLSDEPSNVSIFSTTVGNPRVKRLTALGTSLQQRMKEEEPSLWQRASTWVLGKSAVDDADMPLITQSFGASSKRQYRYLAKKMAEIDHLTDDQARQQALDVLRDALTNRSTVRVLSSRQPTVRMSNPGRPVRTAPEKQ